MSDPRSEAVALLARESASLVERLRLWTPTRWAASADPYGTRGDLVHHLASSFVELAGEAPVALPRLDSDLALPDQLAVTADDLVRTGPVDGVALNAVSHLLVHRTDLLGEDVPRALSARLAALDVVDVVRRGRWVCQEATFR